MSHEGCPDSVADERHELVATADLGDRAGAELVHSTPRVLDREGEAPVGDEARVALRPLEEPHLTHAVAPSAVLGQEGSLGVAALPVEEAPEELALRLGEGTLGLTRCDVPRKDDRPVLGLAHAQALELLLVPGREYPEEAPDERVDRGGRAREAGRRRARGRTCGQRNRGHDEEHGAYHGVQFTAKLIQPPGVSSQFVPPGSKAPMYVVGSKNGSSVLQLVAPLDPKLPAAGRGSVGGQARTF